LVHASKKKYIFDVVKQHNNDNIHGAENPNFSLRKSISSTHLRTFNEVPVLHDKSHTFPLFPQVSSKNNNNNDYDENIHLINNNSLKFSQHSHHTSSSTSQFPIPKMTNSQSIPLRLNENKNSNITNTSSHVPKLQQSCSYSYIDNDHHAGSQYILTKQFSRDDFDDEQNNHLSSFALQTNEITKLETKNKNVANIDVNNHISNANEYSYFPSNNIQQRDEDNFNINAYDNQSTQQKIDAINNNNGNINNNNNNINDSITINPANENMNQHDNQLNVNFPFPVSAIPNQSQHSHQFPPMFSFGSQFNSQSNISLLENGNSIPQDQLLISIGNNNNNNIHNNNNSYLGPLSNLASPIVTPTNQNLRPMTPSSSSLGLAQTPQLANNSNWTFLNINGCIAPVQKISNNFNMTNNNNHNHHCNESHNPYFSGSSNNIIPNSSFIPFIHQNQHLQQFNINNGNNINLPMFNAMPQQLATTNIQPSITKLHHINQIHHPYFPDYNSNIANTGATTNATTAAGTQR